MQPARSDGGSSEYLQAFRTTRLAKNLLLLILLLAVAVHVAAYVVAEFTSLLDPLHAPPAKGEAEPAEPDTSPEAVRARTIENALQWALPLGRFVAMGSAGLLTLTLVFAVGMSLVDRLGGVAGFVGAFYWSLLLLALLVPWGLVLPEGVVADALAGFDELISGVRNVKPAWGGSRPAWGGLLLHYGRFLGGAIVAILIALLVQWRFARGYAKLGTASVSS